MVLNTISSLGVSSVLCVLVFSGLQMNRGFLSSSRLLTLVAGYIASWLFLLMLIAVNNLETQIFGKGFQAKLIPEVVFCLMFACSAAAMVHRVSVTVCILCSMVGLYYVNRHSQNYYTKAATASGSHHKKRK